MTAQRQRETQVASRPVARSTGLTVLALPRIDHSHAQILEVSDVARCERRSSGKCDACDLRVAHVDGPPGALARRGQSRGLGCGGTVEVQHAIFQILLEESVERRLERLPSPPLGQQRKPKTGFEQRDAGDPDRFSRLLIEPSNDALIVSSALAAGCSTLYSEDMHDGMRIGKTLTIRNPFR